MNVVAHLKYDVRKVSRQDAVRLATSSSGKRSGRMAWTKLFPSMNCGSKPCRGAMNAGGLAQSVKQQSSLRWVVQLPPVRAVSG